MTTKWRILWLTSVAAAFLLGALCGPALIQKTADAAQTFGPEEIKSVPPSFMKGGDRNYAMLREIHAVLKENGGAMAGLATNADTINGNLRAVLQRLDAANGHLRNIEQGRAVPIPEP